MISLNFDSSKVDFLNSLKNKYIKKYTFIYGKLPLLVPKRKKELQKRLDFLYTNY